VSGEARNPSFTSQRLPGAGPAGALALAGVSAALGMLVLAALTGALAGSLAQGVQTVQTGGESTPSALAEREIPPAYLALYRGAALRYRLDWALLAAIGKVECDHGRDPDPSCTRSGAVNGAGAGGPMQFLASTWASYGVDGNMDGVKDRWNPADAIYGAARYLRASGAPADTRRAIFAYNHAEWYVDEVLRIAKSYRGSVAPSTALIALSEAGLASLGSSPTPVRFIAGTRAELAPGDGHLALIPLGAPAVVRAMLVAGNELQDLPYGPDGHPDPRGAPDEDCSSTLNYIFFRSGLRTLAEITRDNPLAQDYVHWGLPGPGRWVTIYATDTPTPHVFLTLAGLRIDTSHNGTDVGPNREQDGPRWRILGHIPTWAHWSVRHPPGL
jgi:Transglycosylase SLT domain